MTTSAMTTVVSRPNPYVGPRPYRQGETIYGRERETSELLDLLIAERIILLYSPSGAGKSSLLNAAILPKMQEQGFQIFPVMRANLEPPTGVELGVNFNRYIYSCLQSIEEGLPENERFSIEDLVKFRFKDYLVKNRQRARAKDPDKDNDAPILLVFDQTEEVIRISMTDRPKKLDFFVQLGELLRDRNIWALVAMREDYLASFDPYLRPIPTRFANRYRLTFLDADAAIQAIRRPAENVGVEFPDECARQLVDDLRAMLVQQPDGSTLPELGPTVEPVQLQVVCRRLWINLPNAEKVVTLEHVQALGDVNRALADYYALQAASVANMSHVPEREIREWFQRKLITASGIRGQVLMTPGKSDGLDNRAVWMLERAYLIRVEKRGGATWFELSHDRLVSPIRDNNDEWIEKHLNVSQRRADLWNQQGRPDSLLLIGPEFLQMEEWIKSEPKNIIPAEKEFYQKSLKARQNAMRERAANILIRWLFVASVITVFVALWFFLKSHAAEQKAMESQIQVAVLSGLQSDPERSLLMALAGLDRTQEPSHQVVQYMHQALPAMRIEHASSPQDGHLSRVYSVTYSPDGKFLASASKDGTVIIWDATNLTVIHTLVLVEDGSQYDGYGAFAAAYSPDGKSLAAVAADGKLSVYDTATWSIRYQIAAHKGQVRAVAYSPDGKYIATGGGDSIARVWNAASGEKVYDLGGDQDNQSGIETLLFNLDGSILFVGGDSDDNSVYAWDMATGQNSYKLSVSGDTTTTIINGLALSPDGKLLASAGSDRVILIWNLDTKDVVMEITGHLDWVYGLAFTLDGKSLISASADHTIRVWDVQYGRSNLVLTGTHDQVFGVAVSPTGGYLLASASADTYVRLWDISAQGSREVFTLDHEASVHDVLYSPDGKTIASAGADGVIKLWNASTGALVRKLLGAPRSANVLSWNRDGRYLAAGYTSGEAVLWDLTSGKPALTIPGNGSPVWGLSLNSDGSLIAVGNNEGITHIYNAKTGEEIVKQLDANEQFNWTGSGGFGKSDLWINAAIFSPDGKYIAVGYGTYKIVIWDWKSGKPWMVLDKHVDIVENLTYNADGALLASASDDGTVILWDLNNPDLEDHVKTIFSGNDQIVLDVAFSPDGRYLASGGGDVLMNIWDANARARGETEADTIPPIMNLYGNSNRVHGVAFSPDGRHVVAGSSDHNVRVYTLDTAELLDLARARVTRALSVAECQEYLNMSCQDFRQSDPLKPMTDFLIHLFNW